MFKKKEYLILFAIIIVLSVYLLKKDNNKVEIDIPELSKIEKDTIKKISIENSKGNFSLKIEKKKWSLEPEGFPVLENKVSKMVDLLSNADISDLISRAEKYEKFGLGKNNRTIIKAIGESGDLREIATGNNAESGNRTFVKLKDDKIVYQARGNYKDSFDIKKDDIIDKKIYSFNSSDIVELIIEKEGKTDNFIKIDEAALTKSIEKKKQVEPEKKDSPKTEVKMIWVDKADKKILNQKEIDSFLSKNSSINCESYIKKKDQQEKKGFLYITFIDKTKKSYTINILSKLLLEKEEKTNVSSSNSNFLFHLSKENIESINIDFKRLKKMETKKKE